MRTLPITREHAVEVGSPTSQREDAGLSWDSAAAERRHKISAVQRGGARTIADAPTARERLRRTLSGIGWQALILLAAVVDISVLFVEVVLTLELAPPAATL